MAKYDIGFKLEVVEFYHKNGFTVTLNEYSISNTALKKLIRDSKGGAFMRKQSKNYTVEDKLGIIEYYINNWCHYNGRKISDF